MQLKSVAVLAVLGGVAAVAACDGASTSFASGGSFGGVSDVGPSGTSGTSPGLGKNAPDLCPQSQPVAGTQCFVATCEYGLEADPSCNAVARCSDDQTWVIEQPTHCPKSCPLHFDERAPGAKCSDPDVCTYLEATCGCAGAIIPPSDPADSGVDPDGGEGGAADASEAGAPLIGHWQCVRAGQGCPARRPLLGARCVTTASCDYGSCLFGEPLNYECVENKWTNGPAPTCPNP
jgi:hypothetical protein